MEKTFTLHKVVYNTSNEEYIFNNAEVHMKSCLVNNLIGVEQKQASRKSFWEIFTGTETYNAPNIRSSTPIILKIDTVHQTEPYFQ